MSARQLSSSQTIIYYLFQELSSRVRRNVLFAVGPHLFIHQIHLYRTNQYPASSLQQPRPTPTEGQQFLYSCFQMKRTHLFEQAKLSNKHEYSHICTDHLAINVREKGYFHQKQMQLFGFVFVQLLEIVEVLLIDFTTDRVQKRLQKQFKLRNPLVFIGIMSFDKLSDQVNGIYFELEAYQIFIDIDKELLGFILSAEALKHMQALRPPMRVIAEEIVYGHLSQQTLVVSHPCLLTMLWRGADSGLPKLLRVLCSREGQNQDQIIVISLIELFKMPSDYCEAFLIKEKRLDCAIFTKMNFLASLLRDLQQVFQRYRQVIQLLQE